MENLTHTLSGILLSRAGLERWTPRATAISIVAANLPDIDIITAGSTINYLTYHRHITHSLAATPVMAALAVLLVEGMCRIGRRSTESIRWGPAFGVALIATLSHQALDMTNAYGMRLWLPFDDSWSGWNVLFIVDPWVWIILLLPILAPLALRFAMKGDAARSRMAWAGLGVLVAYIGVRAVLHERAIDTIASLTNESAVTRVAAFPLPLEFFRWSGLAETDGEFRVFTIDTRANQAVGLPSRHAKTEDSEALRKARATPLAREYLRFAQYAYAEAIPHGDGFEVQFSDFRFRRGEAAGFLCTIELDADLNITDENFRFWGGEGLSSFAQRVLRSRP
ncbi:MAG: metal-dependent hydrolase [Acidobacteria bacterium]|nr:metal-dependent hydrolase [Acidobacteriota bacterium]